MSHRAKYSLLRIGELSSLFGLFLFCFFCCLFHWLDSLVLFVLFFVGLLVVFFPPKKYSFIITELKYDKIMNNQLTSTLWLKCWPASEVKAFPI